MKVRRRGAGGGLGLWGREVLQEKGRGVSVKRYMFTDVLCSIFLSSFVHFLLIFCFLCYFCCFLIFVISGVGGSCGGAGGVVIVMWLSSTLDRKGTLVVGSVDRCGRSLGSGAEE